MTALLGDPTAPAGYLDERTFTTLLVSRCNLDKLTITCISDLLQREMGGRYEVRTVRRFNKRGEGIGPDCWIREDSADLLMKVLAEVRAVIDKAVGRAAPVDLDATEAEVTR